MAGGAIAGDAIVIEDRREKCRRVMAEETILRGRYMVRRRILADGIDPVVTPGAVVGHAGVIKHPGGKAAGVMAYATILSGGDVCGGFTRGDRAVVAGAAIAGDAIVIENRGPECRGGMAEVAILCRG